MGLDTPEQVDGRHLMRRVSNTSVMTFHEMFPTLDVGSLLDGESGSLITKFDHDDDGRLTIDELRKSWEHLHEAMQGRDDKHRLQQH